MDDLDCLSEPREPLVGRDPEGLVVGVRGVPRSDAEDKPSPDISSIVSAIFAVIAGARYGELTTDWPRLIRLVVAATAAAMTTDSHTPSVAASRR